MKRRRQRRERRISVRAVRRDPPDLKKLSQALIALAIAQAEAEAEAEHRQQGTATRESRDAKQRRSA